MRGPPRSVGRPLPLSAGGDLTGSGGEEGDRFRLVTQRSQPGEIVAQVACRHSLEESIDGVLQDSMVTVDPAECQAAGAAPGQSGSLLFGSWLEWLDGAVLAGDQFGQLWIGAEAVGADQRSRCDGATQSDDDVVFAAPVQDSLDHTARTIQRGDDGHLFGRKTSLGGARPAVARRSVFRRIAALPAWLPYQRAQNACLTRLAAD